MDIETPLVLATDSITTQTNGDYNKWVFRFSRLQSATDSTSFYAEINGQAASKNLDVSEKMELGGITAVRAYPEGEGYADQGYVMNLESRTQISGQVQLIGFLDTGTVSIDKNPWSSGANRRTLSGAGAGFNWMGSNSFWVKGYYAHKVGDAVAISAPDSSGRFWIQAVKYF
jgi:hemolysin activation/secretion protein